ncbi:MAG: hypothetical protein MZW92_39540 [Comamonadaceae bacterium]|nr:hypothetical protein [Comamonadaceae bacterium]
MIWQHRRSPVALLRGAGRATSATPRAQQAERARDARQLLANTRDLGRRRLHGADRGAARRRPHLRPGTRVRALVEQQPAVARPSGAAARLLPRSRRRAELAQAIDQPAAWLAAARAAPDRAAARTRRWWPSSAWRATTRSEAARVRHRAEPAPDAGAARPGVGPHRPHGARCKLMPEAVGWYRRGGEQVGVACRTRRASTKCSSGRCGRPCAAPRADPTGRWCARPTSACRRRAAPTTRPGSTGTAARWPPPATRPRRKSTSRASPAATSFYGKLAAEELGRADRHARRLRPAPAPEAVAHARRQRRLRARAQVLIDLGLRDRRPAASGAGSCATRMTDAAAAGDRRVRARPQRRSTA